MFFFSPEMLMQGAFLDILHVLVTALLGIYFVASGVQGWAFGAMGWPMRILSLTGGLMMIESSWSTDIIGLGLAALVFAIQRGYLTGRKLTKGMD
jgi:TRAP-type uncharacterized transport system fused permease subunit